MKLFTTDYRYVPLLSPLYRRVREMLIRRRYAGTGVFCPICERESRAWVDRWGSFACAWCGSFTRQRLMWLMLRDCPALQRPQCKVLYFAPDCIEQRLRTMPNVRCVTTDLLSREVDVQADITSLPFDEGEFDLIICSHVLEHVPDDATAMRELHRVLRPGGIALVQVPLNLAAERTDEDFSVTDPRERDRRWGQFDHVRKYGRDIVARLRRAGFHAEFEYPMRAYSADEAWRLGLWDDAICHCRRPGAVNDAPACTAGHQIQAV